MQTITVLALAAVAVGLACAAVLWQNEKNMQEIDANQKEIEKLADRINEISQSMDSDTDSKAESKTDSTD